MRREGGREVRRACQETISLECYVLHYISKQTTL
jgi:hypothetical protein